MSTEIFNSVKKFGREKYGDKLFIIEKEGRLWIQIYMGERTEFYPYIDENNKMCIENATNFDYLNINFYKNGVASFYLWGYEPDGLVDDPDYQNIEDFCFQFEIVRIEELEDIIEYIKKVAFDENFNASTNIKFSSIDVNKIFEEIYVFIPALSIKLIEYQTFKKEWLISDIEDNIQKIRRPLFYNTIEESNEKILKEKEEIDRKKLRVKDLSEHKKKKFQLGDVFIKVENGKMEGLYSYYDVQESDLEGNGEIFLVFRPKKKISHSGLSDFFSSTIEGEEFVRSFLNGGNFQKEIIYIVNYYEQIQYSIEERSTKLKFKQKINQLLETKENLIVKNSLAKKRLRYLESYYRSEHGLVEIFKNPLPFIIEKAFRNFVKSSTEREQLDAGKNLLNILIKTRLLFPLEEFLSSKADTEKIKTILKHEFYGSKKPSDGAFNNLFAALSKEIFHQKLELKCFGNFHKKLNEGDFNKIFTELVESRNRYVHPPFDSTSFLSLLNQYLPVLIESYRLAMRDIDLLIPKETTIVNGEFLVKAEKVMGFESQFDKIFVSIPQEYILNFETNTLVSWNNLTKGTVSFRKFVIARAEEKVSYRIGIFDRYVDGSPMFEFSI